MDILTARWDDEIPAEERIKGLYRMEKTKLSPRQLMILSSGFSYGNSPLLLPSNITALSGPDVWLSILIGTFVGFLFIWIYAKLGELNPDKTLVEIIQLYFGKWAGGLTILFFLYAAFVSVAQVVWYVGDFIRTEFASTMPSSFLHAFFIAVLLFALWCGVETMYRATELLYVFLFTFFIAATLMLIPKMHPENLLPIMENGVTPVLKGSIPFLSSCVLPLVLLNMVYPVCFEHVKEAKKALFKGYLLGVFTNFITVITCVLVLGSNLVANVRFPMFVTNKEIDIAVILSRIEAITFSIWMGVSFITTFCYAYALVFGLSQFLKLKNYKILILPIGMLLTVYSIDIFKDTVYEINWESKVWPPLIFTLGFILPLILLIISFFVKTLENKKTVNAITKAAKS